MKYVGLQWHIRKMGLVCYPLTLQPSSPGHGTGLGTVNLFTECLLLQT